MADEDGLLQALAVEQGPEVSAPGRHADAPARRRAAMAAQIGRDQAPAGGRQAAEFDELRPPAGVARQPVDQNGGLVQAANNCRSTKGRMPPCL
jgi:hypothetical protein